jgi:putative membrane protein
MKALRIFFLTSLFAAAFPGYAHAQYGGGYGYGPGVMHWGYGMMGWFGPIFMLVFWVLIIIAAVYIIKWIAGLSQSETFKTSEAPLDILKKRYAKGEITKAEFEEMKKDVS